MDIAQNHVSAVCAIAFTGSFAAAGLPERLGAASAESRDRQQARGRDCQQRPFHSNHGNLMRPHGTSCGLRPGRVGKEAGGCIFWVALATERCSAFSSPGFPIRRRSFEGDV